MYTVFQKRAITLEIVIRF